MLCSDEAFVSASPSGSVGPVLFPPVKKDESSRVVQEPEHTATPQPQSNRVAGQALLAQSRDTTDFIFRQLALAMLGPRTSVNKVRSASLTVTAHLFPGGSQAYPKSRHRYFGRGGAHSPDHFLSTSGRQFGIFMAVHLFPQPVCCCCGNSSHTDLREGEQPIETLHLGNK